MKKIPVTCDYNKQYECLLYASRGVFWFTEDTAKKILDDAGVLYKISTKDKPYGRDEHVLTIFPDVMHAHEIVGMELCTDSKINRTVAYPLAASDFAGDGASWKVLKGGSFYDIDSLARACTKDLERSIKDTFDAYLEQLAKDGESVQYEFLRMVGEMAADKKVSIARAVESARSEVQDGFIYCAGCDLLVPEDEFHEDTRKVTTHECTYTDAGYGDDDMFGDVTRLVTFRVCDRCGDEVQTESHHLYTENEHRHR